jgi:hypothetical protein
MGEFSPLHHFFKGGFARSPNTTDNAKGFRTYAWDLYLSGCFFKVLIRTLHNTNVNG